MYSAHQTLTDFVRGNPLYAFTAAFHVNITAWKVKVYQRSNLIIFHRGVGPSYEEACHVVATKLRERGLLK